MPPSVPAKLLPMKILVVDDQADSAGSLARSLRDLTGHDVIPVADAQQALTLFHDNPPDVLITEVVLEGMDGFNLRESLRAERPDLRTIFITGYDLSEYESYIDGTPVFYKPVDPQALVDALSASSSEVIKAVPVEHEEKPVSPQKQRSLTDELPLDQRSQSSRLRHLVGKQGFTGKLDQFDLVDIIQLCCISKRTGCLQISRRNERGVLYLRGGQVIQAVSGALEGEAAAYEIIGWSSGQFSFEDGVQPDSHSIYSGWEHLVMEGVRRRDEKAGAHPVPLETGTAGEAQSIGPYQIRRKIGVGSHSEVFEAMQVSMDRVVALKVLAVESQQDEAAVQTFLAQASAKANVQHPSILAVYEAGQHEGVFYYTREYVDGANLAALRNQGRTIDDSTALQCIKVAAEALSYLNQQKIPHPLLTAEDVYLGRDGRARLNNLAALADGRASTTQQDIRALSRMISDCLPDRTAGTPGLRELLGRMLLDGSMGFLSWGALLQAVKTLEPKVVPEDAFKLSARDAAALAAVNEAKRRQKRAMVFSTIGMFALIWLVAAAVYVRFFRAPAAQSFDRMIAVPAGEFIYQKDERVTLPAFWIDEYEVTIGQYAQFLDAIKANPAATQESPDAPKTHRHDNVQWIQLYTVAKSGSLYNGAPVDLNCPAVFVDWFDAYAYARWKGHRLPTQQEWEKAARGTDGRTFPWGNDATQISKVNTSADYHPENGAIKGQVDGYNRWAPVDAMTGDRSPYGVMGMAGNVSEWTASVTSRGPLRYPVVCGGNFGSTGVEVTRRTTSVADVQTSERVGFRTVSDSPPPTK